MNTIKEKWEKNKETNLRWWCNRLPSRIRKFNHATPLPEYFRQMIGNKKEVWIADLGAGVISAVGNTWEGVKVHLYPSDVYGNEFMSFYEFWKFKPFIPIETQDMENLTYKDEMFDIVHSTNALDHCVDPRQALKEMYRVCKKGGWIYLRHIPREGVNNRYMLQHQWNIEKEGEDCAFWNYQDKFLLSECIKGFKTIEKVELPNEPITIVSTLQKI